MLQHLNHVLFAAAVLATATLATTACGSQRHDAADVTPAAKSIAAVHDLPARWNTESGRTLDSLVAAMPYALVAHVVGVRLDHKSFLPDLGDPASWPTVEGKPV